MDNDRVVVMIVGVVRLARVVKERGRNGSWITIGMIQKMVIIVDVGIRRIIKRGGS